MKVCILGWYSIEKFSKVPTLLLRREIRNNLTCRLIYDKYLQEITKYFLTIAFSPSDNFWILQTSRRTKKRIGFAAFLKLSPIISFYHQQNFVRVIKEYKKMVRESEKVLDEYLLKYPYFFDLCLELKYAEKEKWFSIYSQVCHMANCKSNEIIVGFLVASVGCEDYKFCPLWRNEPNIRKICLKKSAYIDFQTTLTHFMGLGIGWKLFSFAVEYLKRRFNRISTMVSNKKIEWFHQKIGSKRLATIPHYYPDKSSGKLYCYAVI